MLVVNTLDKLMNHYHYRIFVDREYSDKYVDDHRMYPYNHEQNIRFLAIEIDRFHLYSMRMIDIILKNQTYFFALAVMILVVYWKLFGTGNISPVLSILSIYFKAIRHLPISSSDNFSFNIKLVNKFKG